MKKLIVIILSLLLLTFASNITIPQRSTPDRVNIESGYQARNM